MTRQRSSTIPAGLTQLHGTQFSIGGYYLVPQFHFHGDDGSNERMDFPTFLPHLYAVSDFGLERLRFGLGVNDTFGINEDWGDAGPLRTVVNQAQLQAINIAPTVAFKVDDHLSLGAALNIYYGSLNLQRQAVVGPPPFPEGQFRLRGSDWAVSFTPALMYKFNEHHSIGAYYRAPFTSRLQR